MVKDWKANVRIATIAPTIRSVPIAGLRKAFIVASNLWRQLVVPCPSPLETSHKLPYLSSAFRTSRASSALR